MRQIFQFIMSIILVIGLCILSITPVFADSHLPTKKIDQYLQEQMKKNRIPGMAVAITYQDQVIYAKGFGTAGYNRLVTPDTPFAIASLSKAFTAMAVMQLVEMGKLKLDTPVQKILPDFRLNDPRGSKITVQHLLHQTSGLADTVNEDMKLSVQPQSLHDVIKRLKKVELESTPGQKYNYHNPNYEILAHIVEVISHKTFQSYLQKHIFQPLQMNQTTHAANIKDFSKTSKNISDGHSLFFGLPIKNQQFDWFTTGSHGIIASVNDMAQWMIMQQNNGLFQGKRLLSSQGIQTMHTQASSSINYGMGWMIGKSTHGEKQFYHDGILGNFKSEMILLPEKEFGIVLLSNTGLNEFIDYYSMIQGVVDLVTGQEPSTSWWINNLTFSLMMLGLVLITILLGIRNLKRNDQWETKLSKQAKWWVCLKLIFRLLPLYLLLFLQPLVSLLTNGREMSWEGLITIAPCIMTLLIVASLFSAIIVITRLNRWLKIANR
ncbi:CubicO group peptidase, beta-lactamase class C family [Seinonella peptonophila]|uniref:CubicO group peptidase, beta-lactamase class C family n=1 Tax=Seinonella peptonophila TaxID=112248 RepID=A0A1M4U150_9BACL|nr:serine hydrolase domain-containing protein [Seinonella peptonophila]SHE50375.1 CubicO group peptidase, beta-lactamase class C family [Seinonella peptonophila]